MVRSYIFEERRRRSSFVDYSRVGLADDQRQLIEKYEVTEENKMPEIKEVPYLKGEDIGTESVITFLTPHEDISAEETGLDKDTAQIMINLPNGTRRIWTMNKTSQRMLVGLLGSNSDTWVGKTATLYTLEQNVRGEMKKVIYVRATQPKL